ncbi:hypothetical protein T459_02705 [Capsicum annuum]|uniref:Inhibitor I9 domain-containing protein n=1 Tax=Capsicum annuum TaxID=4072 RepID=A0A2G3AKY7_CAPAN|nr:hypothetical protein T459_02705 [Capsicum annuum]
MLETKGRWSLCGQQLKLVIILDGKIPKGISGSESQFLIVKVSREVLQLPVVSFATNSNFNVSQAPMRSSFTVCLDGGLPWFHNVWYTFLLSFHLTIAQRSTGLHTYLVHINKPDAQVLANSGDLESYYNSFLPDQFAGTGEPSRIIHSYLHAATGFAAKLSTKEVKAMEKKDLHL